MTTNNVKPKARAILSNAVVLLRKQEPGTTARQQTMVNPGLTVCQSHKRTDHHRPFSKLVSPAFPEDAATSAVWQPLVIVAVLKKMNMAVPTSSARRGLHESTTGWSRPDGVPAYTSSLTEEQDIAARDKNLPERSGPVHFFLHKLQFHPRHTGRPFLTSSAHTV